MLSDNEVIFVVLASYECKGYIIRRALYKVFPYATGRGAIFLLMICWLGAIVSLIADVFRVHSSKFNIRVNRWNGMPNFFIITISFSI